MSVNEKMTAIAEKIRHYLATTKLYGLDDMPVAIDGIFKAGYDKGYQVGGTEAYSNGYAQGKFEGVQEGKAQGQLDEYNRYWDGFQLNGSKWDYNRAFANSCWNAITFKPKYPIHCASCEEMFLKFNHDATFEPVDLSELDISTERSVNFNYMFWNAKVSHIPVIDMSSANTSIYNAFTWSQTAFESPLEIIDEIKIKRGIQFSRECFYKQKNLQTLILSGVLSTSIWLQYCIRLSRESITSVVAAMDTDAIDSFAVFSKEAVDNAFETSAGAADGSKSEEWLNLIATKKNWTISVVEEV